MGVRSTYSQLATVPRAVGPLESVGADLPEMGRVAAQILPEAKRDHGLIQQAPDRASGLQGNGIRCPLAVEGVVADHLGDRLAMLRGDLGEGDDLGRVDLPRPAPRLGPDASGARARTQSTESPTTRRHTRRSIVSPVCQREAAPSPRAILCPDRTRSDANDIIGSEPGRHLPIGAIFGVGHNLGVLGVCVRSTSGAAIPIAGKR